MKRWVVLCLFLTILTTMGSTCKQADTGTPAPSEQTQTAPEQSNAAPPEQASAAPASTETTPPAANPGNDEGGMGEAGEIKEGAAHED